MEKSNNFQFSIKKGDESIKKMLRGSLSIVFKCLIPCNRVVNESTLLRRDFFRLILKKKKKNLEQLQLQLLLMQNTLINKKKKTHIG